MSSLRSRIMVTRRVSIGLSMIFVATLTLAATPVHAQTQVQTLDELRKVLNTGDVIRVVRVGGSRVDGTLIRFEIETLVVTVDRQIDPNGPHRYEDVRIPLSEVRSIERRSEPTISYQAVPIRLEQFQKTAPIGSNVRLTDSSGGVRTGRLSSVSESSLALVVDRQTMTFRETDIQLIERRRTDSLLNGALIGAAIGAGIVVAVVIPDDEGCSGCGAGFLLNAGIGAGIGIGIDAAVRKFEPIFIGPTSTSVRAAVSPILTRGAGGVRVSIRF